jgi:hypothetical protein
MSLAGFRAAGAGTPKRGQPRPAPATRLHGLPGLQDSQLRRLSFIFPEISSTLRPGLLKRGKTHIQGLQKLLRPRELWGYLPGRRGPQDVVPGEEPRLTRAEPTVSRISSAAACDTGLSGVVHTTRACII